ncbi:RNA methyltransferase [Candidatus Saccharibacteria bacterium]|nr:RNA methyltransferase [Candidatus Saccharibacteria bacterium]
MIPVITSPSNPKIKWVKSLHKNSTRRDESVFLVEGVKEIGFAVDGGYLLHSLFVCPEIYAGDTPIFEDIEIYNVTKDCYEKIAYRESSNGLIAVFQAKQKTLDDLTFDDNPFYLVVESVEKPGNLGAIIRTADGAGVDAVIVCDQKTDIFNPNVIRSSVGTLFTSQVVVTSSEDLLDFLQKHEITPYGALLADDAAEYSKVDFTTPTALILGTEHEGLSDFWKTHAQPITIPMRGENDSLNVSNAAAILAYEVLRQREL